MKLVNITSETLMGTKNQSKTSYKNTSKFVGYSTGVLLTLFAPSIIAQQVQTAIEDNKQAADDTVEIIEVSGVRNSLESALNTKREAESIVDA
ncbi:MAG: hypothetical protein HON44_10550, partial [Glaciecola sp.]|nr:hypothetical protein [Glaciecola sp.]